MFTITLTRKFFFSHYSTVKVLRRKPWWSNSSSVTVVGRTHDVKGTTTYYHQFDTKTPWSEGLELPFEEITDRILEPVKEIGRIQCQRVVILPLPPLWTDYTVYLSSFSLLITSFLVESRTVCRSRKRGLWSH